MHLNLYNYIQNINQLIDLHDRNDVKYTTLTLALIINNTILLYCIDQMKNPI
jgi:hypothetical protein